MPRLGGIGIGGEDEDGCEEQGDVDFGFHFGWLFLRSSAGVNAGLSATDYLSKVYCPQLSDA